MANKNPSGSTTGRGEKLKAETPKPEIFSPLDEMLTREEMAAKLKVTLRSIENWQRDGALPYIKIGNAVWFYWPDVIQHLLTHFRVVAALATEANPAAAARLRQPAGGQLGCGKEGAL